MSILSIPFLIIGIIIIILASYVSVKLFYNNKPNYAKLQMISIFLMYILGILYILGAITNYIGLVLILTLIIVIIFGSYREWKYPSYELYVKKEYPKYYEKILLKSKLPESQDKDLTTLLFELPRNIKKRVILGYISVFIILLAVEASNLYYEFILITLEGILIIIGFGLYFYCSLWLLRKSGFSFRNKLSLAIKIHVILMFIIFYIGIHLM